MVGRARTTFSHCSRAPARSPAFLRASIACISASRAMRRVVVLGISLLGRRGLRGGEVPEHTQPLTRLRALLLRSRPGVTGAQTRQQCLQRFQFLGPPRGQVFSPLPS
jgi:hypothetical protein